MRYQFYTADVFTDRMFGGNPLAVFPDARGLDAQHMQAIAREFNLSETVFVFPPREPEHTRSLRIFTPMTELPFAGHPTVGTAHILAATGALPLDSEITRIVFEEGVGPVEVSIRVKDGLPVFCQLSAAMLPEFGPSPPAPDLIAGALSLKVSDLLLTERDGPQAVSCGVPFLYVPLRDLDAVRRARLNRAQWERALATFWAPSLYMFTYDTELENSNLHARMFAPGLGVDEDPATGGAATALAGYLGPRDRTPTGTLRWIVEQGFEMKRPSILEVEADKSDNVITAIRVGGSSVRVSEGVMEIR